MSVAKFLPRDMVFDIVIIDAASQMRPEDALGALLRAKQIVVVGDPKQLPPTDFFDRAMDTDDLDGDEEKDDLNDESILESCAKSFNTVRSLKWHYRSRCESLIAFSNAQFYKKSLITFPMARPGSFSVDLVQIEGAYRANQNPAEAQRIVEESIGLSSSWSMETPRSSAQSASSRSIRNRANSSAANSSDFPRAIRRWNSILSGAKDWASRSSSRTSRMYKATSATSS
jgi:hypothetical protein